MSTWEEARKSPVGDMVRLTAAKSTKKQSTRLRKKVNSDRKKKERIKSSQLLNTDRNSPAEHLKEIH